MAVLSRGLGRWLAGASLLVGVACGSASDLDGSSPPVMTGGTSSVGGAFTAGGWMTGTTGGAAIAGLAGGGPLAGGYVVAGAWHGYAWTAAVTSSAIGAGITTITPADFSGATELCVQGSVGAAADYGGVAMLGVNVNQAPVGEGEGPAVLALPIGGSGITVRYTNPGGSALRVQIQTPLGEIDPAGRWCATLGGGGGTETVTWDMFWGGVADVTQGCWNSGGANPAVGTQISSVALVAPGGNVSPVPFSFCLQGLAQAG